MYGESGIVFIGLYYDCVPMAGSSMRIKAKLFIFVSSVPGTVELGGTQSMFTKCIKDDFIFL